MFPSGRPNAATIVLVMAVALAACGGAPQSTGPDSTPAPTAAAERTPGATAASDLAAMLPDSAGGLELVKSSFRGEDVSGLAISLDEKVLEALATNNKLQLADIEVAEARPRDAGTGGVVVAIRVPGADPKQVVDATFSQSEALRLRTLGGKSVYDVAGTGLNVVVYLKDDVMFQVLGAPDDLTEAIIAALP
ncbi:MAG TPA: hypothetical protein VKB30_02215 [Candidatus Limnocylindrales bacterium]|nr:hypothetical protein [Candidatus Limnocylindrales bacterium]